MKRDPALIPVVITLWLALGVFIIFPFIKLLLVTFVVDGHFSVANITAVFSNTYDRLAFINSIWLAAAVAFMGTFLGFVFAFAVTRIPTGNRRSREVLVQLSLTGPGGETGTWTRRPSVGVR